MIRWALLAAALAAAVAAGYGIRGATSSTAAPALAAAYSASYLPKCPAPSYGADGNVFPLYCRIDNPLALRFYAKIGLGRLLKLGPDASPIAVGQALSRALHQDHATPPEACNEYALAAWAEHWHFAASPVLGMTC